MVLRDFEKSMPPLSKPDPTLNGDQTNKYISPIYYNLLRFRNCNYSRI